MMSRLLTTEEAQEFAELINNYQPNDAVLETFRNSNFVVIAGPAGAGKDTLRDALLARYAQYYQPILSTTTRPPRAGERDGKEYHFWDIESMRAGLERREFFQAALVHNQQISCLHVNEIKKLAAAQAGLSIMIPLAETELRLIKRDVKTIFLVPPTAAILRQRLTAQRTLASDEIVRRMQAAQQEIAYALHAPDYYCIVTDTIENALTKAHDFIQSGNPSDEDCDAAHIVMQEIMKELSENTV